MSARLVLFPQTFRQSILKVPASLFNDIIPMRRDVAGMALAGGDPLTAIARANLLLLERFAHTIGPVLMPAATERAIDHLGLAMRARLDDGPIRRDRSAPAQHFARASLYIVGHLRDPALSVGRIANATGLSVGHLHEVFRRATGATIGDYIRTQRLERCRRDLADQSLRHQSITFIANRWGFSEGSSLSRAFRAAKSKAISAGQTARYRCPRANRTAVARGRRPVGRSRERAATRLLNRASRPSGSGAGMPAALPRR